MRTKMLVDAMTMMIGDQVEERSWAHDTGSRESEPQRDERESCGWEWAQRCLSS